MDFGLLEAGDRVMVCVSGGKDSYCMLHMLRQVQRHAPFDFSIVAVNLDQGHPGYPASLLENWLRDNGYEYRMLVRDTYSIVTEKIPAGQTYCSLCSRLRRGVLYGAAQELGATKIALGHHREDVLETLMLNLFFAGQLKAMPPKLHADDGVNVVIRPMVYCAEDDLAAFAAIQEFPILPCNLCGSQDNMQRKRVKALISELERDIPNIRASMLAAVGNVRPTHTLDRGLMALTGTLDHKETYAAEDIESLFEPAVAKNLSIGAAVS
jgi:tRNA 2-thiocytidine biosynthesis protein TtcA